MTSEATREQKHWLANNPQYARIGTPRAVRLTEWGTLHANGEYVRLDNQPRKPIQVGNGSIGVCIIEKEAGHE